MNLVSIIVPCYNQGRYLKMTLNSVLNQTYKNWECIIVNDGSLDNTERIAREYLLIDKRFKLINQKNQGLSKARNNGIDHSKGCYILPLDSDDIIGSDYITKAVDVLDTNGNISIVYCKAKLFGKKRGEWNLPDYSLERMLGGNCIFCSAFFRRSDFLKTKGYNPNMIYGYEDWDFWLSILELGGDVYKIDDILFFYRIRSNSMNKNIDENKLKISRKQIYLNHKQLYNSNFFNPIYSFEYERYACSPEYKIGKILLFPIRFIYSKI